jgi:hypothetical protein
VLRGDVRERLEAAVIGMEDQADLDALGALSEAGAREEVVR